MVAKSQKNALLTKPNKVLRDTFVRQGHIGFTDLGKLSKWLENEGLTQLEPDVAFWRKLYTDGRYPLKGCVRNEVDGKGISVILEQLARPVTLDDSWCRDFVSTLADPSRFMIKTLDWGRVKVYAVDDDRLALILTDSFCRESKILHSDPDEDIFGELRDPEAFDAFDAALHGWNWWRAAHDWQTHPMCAWMSEALDALRMQAGAMFDEAVAVSPDGRRVQAADVVVAYAFDAKKRLTFSVHQAAEFKERKIALGRLHAIPVKPTFRKKTDDARLQDALKPRAVRKCVVELESHACHQAMLVLGKQRILFTPSETLPKLESMPSPKPNYPARDRDPDVLPRSKPPIVLDGIAPPPFDSDASQEREPPIVLDGVAASPFDDASDGDLIGPPFESSDGGFDMNTPVYYGPLPVDVSEQPLPEDDVVEGAENVDLVDPAQKPPQCIETPAEPNPDVPSAGASDQAPDNTEDAPHYVRTRGRGMAPCDPEKLPELKVEVAQDGTPQLVAKDDPLPDKGSKD